MGRFRGVATKYLDRYLTWHVIHWQVQHLSATRARAVLVGNTAGMRPERCCPECGAILSAARQAMTAPALRTSRGSASPASFRPAQSRNPAVTVQ